MPGPQPSPLALTSRQHDLLVRLVRRLTSPQWLVVRATLILALAAGGNNDQISRQRHLTRHTVRLWRQRWLTAAPSLAEAEAAGATEAQLTKQIQTVLADAPRSGAPPRFTPEQICQLLALACTSPAASERPVTHWTPTELAQEAVKRGIVDQISPRSVGRFLKGGQAQAASEPVLAHQSAGGGSRRL